MSYVLRFVAWLLPAHLCHLVFRALAWTLSKLPQNSFLWAYTIKAKDGKSPYITRCLFPRWRGTRTMLHWIHRPDQDEEMHDHPWAWGGGQVLLGGYLEERAIVAWTGKFTINSQAEHRVRRRDYTYYGLGDKTHLTSDDWHRIVEIHQPTWTLFRVGERVQDWGFMVQSDPIVKEQWQDFFKRKGIAQDKVAS